ncbi:Mu transposase C-terminal domain-containing protein [Streptomyces cinerochromogenes]|uniref:Mu transposase C-terminal domain-containing protein n=1 Tax=Streptomyces cinerochromogenes TaxID=66422 RepID=UPI0016716449|nr:Mu transposase C-terminal domain-containing protein [Streptomyces cinerochromogenes]GGT02885.1 transposase [Streptomyces cinerochromogenes]
MGAQVRFEDRAWQVIGLADGRVYLVAGDGATACVLAARLVVAPGFAVIGAPAAQPVTPVLWEAVPLAAQERALAWLRHIREVETGLPGGPGSGTPRPEYDPRAFTLAEREAAKAQELTGLGWARVSRATVQRMRLVYGRQGLWGLVDKRHLRGPSPTGRTDERVVAAVLEALRRCRGRRKTTIRQVIELTEQIVADTHGPHQVRLPARSSLYRLVKALADPAEPPGSAARTATAGGRAGGPPAALRPGERVQVATARLPVGAVGEDGTPVVVAVTAALDQASGCVLAAVLHAEQDGPVELSVLLAEMAVPRSLRPGWPALLEQAHAGGPVQRLMSLPDRIEATASRPAAVPETLVLDRGPAGITSAHLTVCESLSISLEPAPPRAAGAASGALRTLQVLAGLFTRHAVAVRPAVTAGQEDRADGVYWSMPQLQDLLDEWITGVWHHRPQEQLRHPLLPRAGLTPQEMWQVLLGAAGRVPLPLAGQAYGELLPARRSAVTESGIRLGGRCYDDACLDEHRGRGDRFEVHHHPHDPRQVFVRLPDGQLHAVPWAQGEHGLRPFDELLRRRTGTVLAHRAAGAGAGADGGVQPGSDRAGPSLAAAQSRQAAARGGTGGAVPGTASGGKVAVVPGGLSVYDAEAEAGQW